MANGIHTQLASGDTATVEEGSRLKVVAKLSYLGRFTMIYNYALRKAFADLAEAMQTIGPLITMVKNENQVIFRPAALATELGVSKATVERHISKARQLGLIEPDGIEHGVTQGFRVWRLCPFLAWQGTGNALRDYLRTLPANHPWFDYQDPDLS